MKEKIANRLLTVKSIVTILLTVVFAVLTVIGRLDQNFMMIYTVIISFYFGTQSNKQPTTQSVKADTGGGTSGGGDTGGGGNTGGSAGSNAEDREKKSDDGGGE